MTIDKISNDHISNIKINQKYTDKRHDIDIDSIFGKEYLEYIQRVISDVTGLAFVTIDYKGKPITEMTNFSNRCRFIRKNPMYKKICELSDATGAIRAAVSKKSSIYYCPFNLLEVAIPIIINDQYLGAFIGGQVMCDDPPSDIMHMQNQFLLDDLEFSEYSNCDECKNCKKYTFKEFESIVKLVELIISEIIKKELVFNYHEEKYKNKIKELEDKVDRLNQKELELKSKISSINNSVNTLFLNNMMESLSNLALIEEAHETSKYSEHLKNFIIDSINADYNSVGYVLKTLMEYFSMKAIQYGDRFHYEIHVPENVKEYKMPFKILITYVIVMCHLGLSFKEDIYYIKVKTEQLQNKLIVFVEDNGFGISKNAFDYLRNNQEVGIEIANIFEYIFKLEEDFEKISRGNPTIHIEESKSKTVVSLIYNIKS